MSFNPRSVDYDLVIIGSGIAGLAAAQVAAEHGLSVKIFDKGRRIGGRAATRRAGGVTFTHGAQFMTARTDEFRNVCSAAIENGALKSGRLEAKPHLRVAQPCATLRYFSAAILISAKRLKSQKLNQHLVACIFIQPTA